MTILRDGVRRIVVPANAVWDDFFDAPGQGIGGYDALIAGHARSQGLIVVAGNLREFSRVEGLRAEDWLASPAP